MTLREAQVCALSALEEAGCDEARAQSLQLVQGLFGFAPQRWLLERDRQLSPQEETTLRQALDRRCAGEPLQYILGHWEFAGREFLSDPRALIPREDTQVLTDTALSILESRSARVVDLGCGTGIVGITLALDAPASRVTCLDVSADALSLARENAARLGADVRFTLGDMRQPLSDAPWDLIVSNPPYIAEGDRETLAQELSHEPDLALFAGADGLDFYRALADRMQDSLAPSGWIAVEVGAGQAEAVADLFRPHARELRVEHDFAGIQRVVAARKKG